MCRTHSSTMQTHKVTVQGHEFKLRILWPLCISFTPGRIFSNFGQMFTSVGQCAEPIIQPCGFEVNVTVEGHDFEPWIWCRLHISFSPGRIFFKRWSNVYLSEMMCRTYNSAMLTRSRSQLKVISLSLELWGRSIAIQTALLNLGQMFALVRWCVEPITKRCRFNVKVTIEGHPSLSCSLHISWTLWKFFMNLWSNVWLVMCRTYNSSMPTQGQGHS